MTEQHFLDFVHIFRTFEEEQKIYIDCKEVKNTKIVFIILFFANKILEVPKLIFCI